MFIVRRLVANASTISMQAQRAFSESTLVAPVVSFAEVRKILQSNSNNEVVLLDVREKGELVTDGKIPQGKNVPLGEVPAAFSLDDESFSEKYGFQKPKNDQAIVIHCKAGVRAQLAAKSLLGHGYNNLKVYSGILDWKQNGGETA